MGGVTPSRNAIFNHELIEFSGMGSGFAGDSACWFYSRSFGIFVVQGHPGRLGGRRGLVIDEVAARVSFTVETTVLPSFALPRGSCKWEGFDLVLCVFQPRIDRISRMGIGFAGESACWFYSCLFGIFVVQEHPGRMGQTEWFHTFSV